MDKTPFNEPQGSSFREHLIFVALLIPTFVVLAAAVVSFAGVDPVVVFERPLMTAAACDPCAPGHDADEGP